jgi:RNA polymerase sigma-70 factor (ECF subfamily)
MLTHQCDLAKGSHVGQAVQAESRADGLVRVRAAATSVDRGFEDAVQAARRGDDDAFRMLYHTLTPHLLRYAAVIVGQDAEDVVAEVWLQLARDMLRFDGDGPALRRFALRRFALTVTRNRSRDLVRRSRRRVAEVSGPWSELPERHGTSGYGVADAAVVVGERLSTQEALTMVARLPQPQAEAVMLRVILDLDTRSTARILGKRPGAVAMALSRGLRRLAQWVERPAGAEHFETAAHS